MFKNIVWGRLGNFIGCILCFLMIPAVVVAAEKKRGESEERVVSGMSIVGNDETPKALYIVPWKSSETVGELSFTSSILNEELKPVDKDDFIRRLGFIRGDKSN